MEPLRALEAFALLLLAAGATVEVLLLLSIEPLVVLLDLGVDKLYDEASVDLSIVVVVEVVVVVDVGNTQSTAVLVPAGAPVPSTAHIPHT